MIVETSAGSAVTRKPLAPETDSFIRMNSLPPNSDVTQLL